MTIDTRWSDPDRTMKPAPRDPQELRERLVQDIAQARFEFPTPELPSYRTYVNVPDVNLPVTAPDGTVYTPDIVVVDTPGNILRMLAQVEISETVTAERARDVWTPYAKLPDAAFYLYVPVGYGGAAKRIAKKLGIEIYGYRTWRYTPHGLEINDVSEPPGIMAALMPPFVRKVLRGV